MCLGTHTVSTLLDPQLLALQHVSCSMIRCMRACIPKLGAASFGGHVMRLPDPQELEPHLHDCLLCALFQVKLC